MVKEIEEFKRLILENDIVAIKRKIKNVEDPKICNDILSMTSSKEITDIVKDWMYSISSDSGVSKGDINCINKYFGADQTKNKIISLFFEAISNNIDSPDYEKVAFVSIKLEAVISSLNKSKDAKLVRSKYLNLKDKSNPILCKSVYEGIISPEKFISMSQEEMKSDLLKEKEEDFIKKSLFDSQIAKKEAETDMFFCTKCKQRKATYRQLQTRSADEPMTTYVYCVCGNTWKFS
ncbi:transcription elongation factor S-II [Hamiltosporidium tvaerminnensis]|uniref:Transcription elongation factor S-II n=1 Tax=Hamiltosporidium tvaerminnensis TaxID=1176355 RepID=A0A4Q9LZR7_9MICR|nr:transcription elongation factor S-II [Hamiltosporidium tvaerminnensis]